MSFGENSRAPVRSLPVHEPLPLDERICPDARRREPGRLAPHFAFVCALPDVRPRPEPPEILRHRLSMLNWERLAVVRMAFAASYKLEVNVRLVVRVVDVRRRDPSACRKRHDTPVPVRHHVAHLHTPAVFDDEVRSGAVMIPRWFNRISRRTAEYEFRARAVEDEILEPVDDDARLVEASVGSGLEHNLCRADALGLVKRRLNRRTVHLVRPGKAEVLRLYDSPAVHARRRDLERRTSDGDCPTGDSANVLVERKARQGVCRLRRACPNRGDGHDRHAKKPIDRWFHSVSLMHCSLKDALASGVDFSSSSQAKVLRRSPALSASPMR